VGWLAVVGLVVWMVGQVVDGLVGLLVGGLFDWYMGWLLV